MSQRHPPDTPGKTDDGGRTLPSGPRPVAPIVPAVGPYLLLDELGAGGMGRVYTAMHTRLKRLVAVKLLPEGRLRHPLAVARFQQEWEAVGQLDHPNVVRATDAGEDHGHYYLVMEYVDGLDLDRLMRRCGPLSVADACEAVRQGAAGLQAAHEHGLVHRDVKPSNLILSRAGQVKLLDLGLARLEDDDGAGERLTPSGEGMGTPDYMAPEQAFDARKADIRADIYSLGCTLYKLLTGRPPFGLPQYESRMRKLMAHAQEPVPPVSEDRSDLPAGLDEVIERLMSKDPDGRPSTPAEVARLLEPYARGADLGRLIARAWSLRDPQTDRVKGAGALAETQRYRPATDPARPRPPRWAVVVGLLFVLGGLALGAYALWPPSEKPPDKPPIPNPLPKNKWIDLLDRPPSLLVWNDPRGESRQQPNLDRRELFVDTRNEALFGLGKAPYAGYELTVRLSQKGWEGGAGVFFGYQKFEDENGPGVKYQAIMFHREGRPGNGVRLVRYLHLLRPPGGVPPHRMQIAEATVKGPPAPSAQTLTIAVRKRGLHSVTWNGEALERLFSEKANERFRDDDYRGEFGVAASQSSTTFSMASWLLHEEDK